MLYVQEKIVKLGGIYLTGQVTNIEIQETASIDDIQDDKGKTKASQPTGYEAARVTVDILLEDSKDKTTLDQIQDMQRLFKAYGQKTAKLLQIVNQDCSARGISKVYFNNFTSKNVISESKRIVSLELLAPTIAGIKVKKVVTKKKKVVTKKESSKSKKMKTKTPAGDTRSTNSGKKAAKRIIKS